MFQHTFLLIYRNCLRFKSTFFINLIGLSTGLACTLFIYLWVTDELGVDKFHANDSRLFRVMENHQKADGITTSVESSGPLAEALPKEMPEIEYAVVVAPAGWFGKFTLSVGENKSLKAAGQYASKDFFKIFSYDLIQGDKARALADPKSMVISDELARQLFRTTENVVGRTVKFQNEKSFIISGVFEKIPANSTEQFDFVMTWEEMRATNPWVREWGNTGPHNYVVLKEGASPEQLNCKIANYIKNRNVDSARQLFLKRYSENYLYGQYENGKQAGGRIEYVRLFSIIALFILVIACINFMNLSTAKASRRLKEVGIKKALGASRPTLIQHYLGESLFLTLLALLAALMLVQFFLPAFNQITSKQLALHFDFNLIIALLIIALFTGLVAGSYPALYLSGFNPVLVLKGKINSSVGELWARKGLVVFQFTLSVILIVSVMVVYKQIEFVQTRNIGYSKDHILYFGMEGKVAKNRETFLSEIKKIPGVVNAASTKHDMIGHNYSMPGLEWPGKNPQDLVYFECIVSNYDLIETLGIQMQSGRSFSRDFGADSTAIIFNEAAIDLMGLKDPVGKKIKLWGEDRQIIGVVKNFHFESLHETVKPLFFSLIPKDTDKVMAKIQAGKEKEVVAQLQAFYQKYNPGFTFDYKFLDADYQAQYTAEQRVAVLSRYFAGLAILISCLGLFGLAAFTAERRRKEIGVRKVLGASEISIVYLLSGDFTKMVIVAICFSLPLSYLLVKYWLQNFEYRIPLEWWYFMGAGLTALLIAWLTVGVQAVKAARMNPTHSLKDE